MIHTPQSRTSFIRSYSSCPSRPYHVHRKICSTSPTETKCTENSSPEFIYYLIHHTGDYPSYGPSLLLFMFLVLHPYTNHQTSYGFTIHTDPFSLIFFLTILYSSNLPETSSETKQKVVYSKMNPKLLIKTDDTLIIYNVLFLS